VGPARASVITYVNPAVAVALGILVLSERLTLTMAIAFVAILGGSVLATRTGRRATEGAGVAGTVASSTRASVPVAAGTGASVAEYPDTGQMAGTGYRSAPSGQPD